MDVLFDVLERTLTIVPHDGENQTYGTELTAKLNRHNQVVPLRGVRFGFTLMVNGEEAESKEWPPARVQYIKTDQDTLATYRLHWTPDSTVVLYVWLIDSMGVKHEDTLSFTAPKPASPYPSWEWADGQWNPPVPRPEDDKCYEWDEENVNWLEVPCDPVPEPEPEIPVDSGNVINVDPIVLPDNLGNGTI